MKKVIIIGDSYTFFMSGDPRVKQYLDHLNLTDNELYPIYWTSHFENTEDEVIYSWRLATGARKLNSNILDSMILKNKVVKRNIKNNAVAIFAFGAMEFWKYLPYTRDPKTAAKKYFYEVSTYCLKNKISFRFVSPITNSTFSYMIDDFNNEIDILCSKNNIASVIRYNDSNIPYNKYDGIDKYNHPSPDILRDASRYILNIINT